MDLLKNLAENLQKGDTEKVSQLTKQALDQKIDPKVILDQGLIKGMAVIGELFKNHKIFLPHVLLAAKAMYAGMDLLKPIMIKEGIPSIGKVVIGTVQGDMHDIGKNLVGIMLKGAGFELIDLGKDIQPMQFIKAAREHKADIIGMSALLTTTMPVMEKVIELAKSEGIYGKVKFLVGGAPLSEEYAKEIGADKYCFDGINAVECARKFVSGS
jgi:5-methyltetrahydrofolate--homocysteine methyltransferase